MLYALCLCLLLGLCNLVVAIYISEISARKTSPYVFYGMANLLAGLFLIGLCIYRGIDFSAAPLRVSACMFSAAFSYTLETAVIIGAYKYGDRILANSCHTICYAIPVVIGIVLFHETPGLGGYLGMALLLAGTLLGAYEKRHSIKEESIANQDRHFGKWLVLLLVAIALSGCAAISQSLPSWMKLSDAPPLLRATLIMCYTTIANFLLCGIHRIPFWREIRPILPWCAAWAIIGATTNVVFFLTVDAMTKQNIGALTFPVNIGIMTIGFSLYARIRFRELFNWATILTVLLCLLGVICIGLREWLRF